jgi:hypothetical protein
VTTVALSPAETAFLVEIGRLDAPAATRQESLSTGQTLCGTVRSMVDLARSVGLSQTDIDRSTATRLSGIIDDTAIEKASAFGGIEAARAEFARVTTAALRDLCPEFAPIAAQGLP